MNKQDLVNVLKEAYQQMAVDDVGDRLNQRRYSTMLRVMNTIQTLQKSNNCCGGN